ncbi:MAG: addiction module protein [Nevskia sp.]|nr:addiction module protein [Nevskia sp.]
MNATLEKIARDALQLEPAQRAELAELMVESLDSASLAEIQRLWIGQAHRRLAEIQSGKVKTIPGEEVLSEARRIIQR